MAQEEARGIWVLLITYEVCDSNIGHTRYIFWVQVRLMTEVPPTPSSTRTGFELMTSRSWQCSSCHWDACSNHQAISDLIPMGEGGGTTISVRLRLYSLLLPRFPGCPTNAIQMGQATWEIRTVAKKYNPGKLKIEDLRCTKRFQLMHSQVEFPVEAPLVLPYMLLKPDLPCEQLKSVSWLINQQLIGN